MFTILIVRPAISTHWQKIIAISSVFVTFDVKYYCTEKAASILICSAFAAVA